MSEAFNGKKRPLAASSMDDALDRIVLGGATNNKESFLSASTWQGSKPGYYFGTGKLGIGYYRDGVAKAEDGGNEPRPPAKKRRGVQIAEERNETRVIVSAEELLQRAEDEAKQSKVIDLTVKGVRTAATALSKAAEKNEMQRAEYAHDPEQYMDSEVALYENISILKALAADPAKLYPAIIETELLGSLVQLLMHENTDIVASVITVLLEWLDSSLLEEEDGSLVAPVAALASSLLQNGAELLVGNLGRLHGSSNEDEPTESNENDDEVGKGAEDILSLLENLMEMDVIIQSSGDEVLSLIPNGQSVAATLCKETRLVSWLFQQLEAGKQLRDRSLEMLALLSPREDVHMILPDWSKLSPFTSTLMEDGDRKPAASNGKTEKPGSKGIDAIEILLQSIAVYRKKQPTNDQEVESLENACMVLASALTYSSTNVQAFLDRQGIELVVRCLKERVHAGGAALKVLDFSGSDPVYRKACEHIVEAGALKFLFPVFMGRNLPKMAPIAASSKKAKRDWIHSIETDTIRIIYNLVRNLRDDSPNEAKERLLAKFVGDERCDRIVEQCLAYDEKARLAEYKFYRSDVEDAIRDESAIQLAALDAKLAGGGDIFHRLAAVAAFCCVGSKRCHERIFAQLSLQQSGVSLLRVALEEFASVLEEDSEQRRQLESYLDKI